MVSVQAIQEEIKKKGKLPGGAAHDKFATSISGRDKTTAPALIGVAADEAPESKIDTLGEAPEGYGQTFVWGREDPQALLAVFVSASDPAGVSIVGLQSGDRIIVTSATGLASFAEDHKKTELGVIGLVATGAEVIATAEGAPQAIPFIKAGEEFAKEQFKPDDVHTKVRDAFGQEPTSGLFSRREGGVLVCLPEAGGTFYSGGQERRWIKGQSLPVGVAEGMALPGTGERNRQNDPDHVDGAFFLNRKDVMNQTAHTTFVDGGQAYLIAWDHIFPDNVGSYKIFVGLQQASDVPLVPGPD